MSEITLEDLIIVPKGDTLPSPKDTNTAEPKALGSSELASGQSTSEVIKYIIIPDAHIWDKNIRGRIDYVGEVKEYMNQIVDMAKVERESCDKLIAIFAGDIYHKGFKDVEEYAYWFNWFLMIREIFEDVFSVLGNHELTYYKNNPFWSLVSELETNELQRLTTKVYEPKGQLPIIRVVDKIQDGEWTIHLAHFTCSPLAEGSKNIGIFHSSIIDNVIANTLKDKYGRDPLTEYIDHSYIKNNNPFINMEYAFVAHMHKAFGLFTVETEHGAKTRLRYMASLGRTNEGEVHNEDLLRVVPVIEITDGKECKVKELELRLLSREESLVLSEIEENKLRALNQKEVREFKALEDYVTDPVEDLKLKFRDDEELSSLFDASINSYEPDTIQQIKGHILKGVNYDELETKIRELSSKEN